MKGENIKEFLRKEGVSISEAARRLGISQQALSSALASDNVKSGTMEAVAEVLGKRPWCFYGDDSGTALVGTATQSTVIGKQETGTAALEKQLSVKDQQIALKDQQIDRLLALLERWK